MDWKYSRFTKTIGPMLGLVAAVVATVPGAANAETFPSKPIKLIVPYPPGGGNDVLARIVAPGLSEALGQQVVVENRGGGGGTIGSNAAAKAGADGYTMLIVNTLPHTAAAGLYSKLPYDPVKDFRAVGGIATVPYVLVVNPAVPANSVADLLSLARSKPGSMNYASAGVGSATHLAGALFNIVTSSEIKHVPYKGGGPALTDLMGGQVDLTLENILAVSSHIKSGKLRALAVTTDKRSSVLPDLPTVAESGYPTYNVGGQFGLVVPAGTPQDRIARLNAALTKVVNSPETAQQLRGQGGEPGALSATEFDALIRAESEKWLGVMKQAGVTGE